MFKAGHEVETDGQRHLNNKINNIKDTLEDPKLKMLIDFFDHGLPLVPFPEHEKCLGISPRDSTMKIKDGYAILAYNFKVIASHPDCLFNMVETLKQKELRLADEAQKDSHGGVAFARGFGGVIEKLKDQANKSFN